jgi:hypothetical protein
METPLKSFSVKNQADVIGFIDPVLLLEEPEDPRYTTSPFRKLKTLGPKQRGSRYEKISECILKGLGYAVMPPKSTDHDRIVNGCSIEIKGSMLGAGSDKFSFLQIRPNQDYEELWFVMFYPHRVEIWKMNKNQVQKCCDTGVFGPQHGGKTGDSGTFCYYGNENTLRELGALKVL